jgi:hypothetical protein
MNQKILIFTVIGMIILFLVIMMILVLYNRHVINEMKNSVNDNAYEQDKINTNSELIQIMNKSIVDYINSLNIADGDTLNRIEGETTAALQNVQNELDKKDRLIEDLKKQVNDNKSNISKNKSNISSNSGKIEKNSTLLYDLISSVKYDDNKVMMSIIQEYDKKYTPMNTKLKDICLITRLFTLGIGKRLAPPDEKDSLPHDFITKQYKTEILQLMNLIITNFDVEKIYSVFQDPSFYSPIEMGIQEIESEFPFDDILKSNTHVNFYYKKYLPRLLNYVAGNKISIYNRLDDMMINYYYKNRHEYSYFYQFLFTIKVEDVVNSTSDDYTLMLDIIKAIHKEDFTSILPGLRNTSDRSRYVFNKFMYIILPSIVILSNYYADTHIHDPLLKFFNSKSFSNITDSYLESQTQTENFLNLAKFFRYDVYETIQNSMLRQYYNTTLMHKLNKQLIPSVNNAVNRYLLHPESKLHEFDFIDDYVSIYVEQEE